MVSRLAASAATGTGADPTNYSPKERPMHNLTSPQGNDTNVSSTTANDGSDHTMNGTGNPQTSNQLATTNYTGEGGGNNQLQQGVSTGDGNIKNGNDDGSNNPQASDQVGEGGIKPNFTGERQQEQGANFSDIASTIPGGNPQASDQVGEGSKTAEDDDGSDMGINTAAMLSTTTNAAGAPQAIA